MSTWIILYVITVAALSLFAAVFYLREYRRGRQQSVCSVCGRQRQRRCPVSSRVEDHHQ